jgi:hypothetical protein
MVLEKENEMSKRSVTALRLFTLVLGLTAWAGHVPAFAAGAGEDNTPTVSDPDGPGGPNDQSGIQDGPNDESTLEDADGVLGQNR